MKLISLNTWGGLLKGELHNFVKKHAADTDIFCFQEIFDNALNAREVLGKIDINLYNTLTELLSNHIGYYAPSQENDEGLAIFVKPSVKVIEVGDVFVYRHLNAMKNDDSRTLGRNIQYALIADGKRRYTIINFHGLWDGGGKKDTPGRLEQSRKIKEFIRKKAEGKVILVGDFNLEPDTESLAILEKGMRNLIKEFHITSTRSHYYTKPVKFADYAVVSDDLNVIKFEVLDDPVSDHLPLVLEFS